MSKPPPPAPTASALGPCPTVIKIVGRPGTGSLPSTIAPPDHPTVAMKLIGKRSCGDRVGSGNTFFTNSYSIIPTSTRLRPTDSRSLHDQQDLSDLYLTYTRLIPDHFTINTIAVPSDVQTNTIAFRLTLDCTRSLPDLYPTVHEHDYAI